jgi:predicted ATPase
VESGLLGVIDQHDVMSSVSTSCVIPTTLLGSLTARFDKLAPSKKIAQIGAAIGREFSYRLLAAVALSDEHSLRAALSRFITG